MTFEKELEKLINKHSLESDSDTPDFILAKYLKSCLLAFNGATRRREKWYGRETDEPEVVQRVLASPQQTTGILLRDYIFGKTWDHTQAMREELKRRGYDPLVLYKAIEKQIENCVKIIDEGGGK